MLKPVLRAGPSSGQHVGNVNIPLTTTSLQRMVDVSIALWRQRCHEGTQTHNAALPLQRSAAVVLAIGRILSSVELRILRIDSSLSESERLRIWFKAVTRSQALKGHWYPWATLGTRQPSKIARYPQNFRRRLRHFELPLTAVAAPAAQ